MKELEIRKRKWALTHLGDTTQIDAEIADRVSTLKKCVWNSDDSEPFEWWVSGLLGVVPKGLAILRGFAACLQARSGQRIVENILCYFSAISAVEYFSRTGNKKCRVLLYERPDRIPTGFVHLFDLGSKELETGLKTALKTHGIKVLENFLLNCAESAPLLPVKKRGKKAGIDLHCIEAEKHSYLAGVNSMLSEIGVQVGPTDRKRAGKFAGEFFTPEVLRVAEERLGNIGEKYTRTVLQKDGYREERVKTLAASAKNNNTLPKVVQEQLLKVIAGVLPNFGSDNLRHIFGTEAPALRPGPDALYRLEREIFACRKEVQRQCALHATTEQAFRACRVKFNSLTRERFEYYRVFPGNDHAEALAEAAERLNYSGAAYAERVYRQARTNARINTVWTEYLAERYPMTGHITADNFPDKPPVRCSS